MSMKTIRRLYFYAVALISLEVVLWGGIGLLRSIVARYELGGADALARALALILVGVPIFLFHWLWAQRSASRDEEERDASLRAIFLYAVMIGTLVPVTQNLLALINRLLLGGMGLSVSRAIVGGGQSWSDNLIAIFINLIVAAYFWNVLRGEWRSQPGRENFADVRRLYRYLWVLYGLLMMVFGAQQLLRFVFYVPTDTLGGLGRETFVNGLALLLVGTPIWVYTWRICQNALVDSAEQGSTLRLVVLYLLALGGVISVLTAGGSLLYSVIERLLGDATAWSDFIQRIGGPISVGVPLAVVWAYFGRWRDRHIEAVSAGVQREALKRPHAYILSLIGLVTAFIGVTMLISIIIDLLVGSQYLASDFMRQRVSAALATLLVGLPVWLSTWLPISNQAAADGDSGVHARRSLIRKAYLYLVLFASVIGGMISAVTVVFRLLNAALTGHVESGFLASTLNLLQLLALFAVVLIYHLQTLQHDGQFAADTLAVQHGQFAVLVIDPGDGDFAQRVRTELSRRSPHLLVAVVAAAGEVRSDAAYQAVILPASLAFAPDFPLLGWLRQFNGTRLIVPDKGMDSLWADNAEQAAVFARQLSEGQTIRRQKRTSAWTVVIYIFAILFAIQLAFGLLVFGLSLIFG
jgi:hypothetical protein